MGKKTLLGAAAGYVACIGGSALGGPIFTNPGAITIPGSGTGPAPAAPYPSTILVAGLGAAIADVNVSIMGLSHTFPDDIDMLLVGPTGTTVMLMSDVGGGLDVVSITLTFDQGAPSLPDAALIVSGTYSPTNIGATDTMPAPAPAGPYGTTLAAYNGTDGNGTWSLYIYDDASLDVGSISGGWSLTFTLVPAPGALALLGLAGLAGGRRRRS